jgi:hypothetical protein
VDRRSSPRHLHSVVAHRRQSGEVAGISLYSKMYVVLGGTKRGVFRRL